MTPNIHIMKTSFRFLIVLFKTIFLVFSGFSAIGQYDCNCNPQINIVYEDCATRGKPTEIGFYIYGSSLSNISENKRVKVYIGTDLVLDKAAVFSDKGFFSDVFSMTPTQDAQFIIEFYCNEDNCFTTHSEIFRTIPDYTIESKDISCFGSLNGEVKLMPEMVTDMDIVWESGDRKNFVENMHFGTYHVTVENTNGCKEIKELIIQEPKSLQIDPKFLTIDDNGQIIHCMKAEVSGGQPKYLFDWDQNGMGQMSDDSHIICTGNATHKLMVMDNNGCTAEKVIEFEEDTPFVIQPQNGSIKAYEDMGDGRFKYDLTKSLNPEYGDIDGDKSAGSILNTIFSENGNIILKPEEFISDSESIINVEFTNEIIGQKTVSLAISSGFFFLRNNASVACNYFDPIIIDGFTQPNNPLPAGGTFKVFEPTTLIEYTSQVLNFNATTNVWTWSPMFSPPVAPLRYVLYYINGTDTLQSQLNVVSTSGSVDVLASNVCGNGDLVQILCSPRDGILVGRGLSPFNFLPPNSDQIIYFIDPSQLGVDSSYTYTYTIPGSTGTMSNLRCAAVISDNLNVLPFPSIDINTLDVQVCAKESISLSSTTAPTSGNQSGLTYQWFFRMNNITIPIISSNNAQLVIPEANNTGQYIVRVTQSNGCTARDTALVQVFELPKVSSEVLSDITCFGVSSAIVNLSIDNVTDDSLYTFRWVGRNTGSIFTGRFQNNLPADSFFITVTTPPVNVSGLQCSLVDTVVINSYPSIGIVCSPRDVTVACFGDTSISRIVSVSSSALGPFGYSLSSKNGPWQNSPAFTGLGVGNDPLILSRDFKVFVRDGNGCVDSCLFTINQPQQLRCSIQKTDLTCFQNGSGSATATVSGGISPFRYAWRYGTTVLATASSASTINGLAAGIYGLTVTDANNCTTTCSITVNEPTGISPNVNPATVCLDHTTQLTSIPSGGTGSYNYAWSLADAGSTSATSAALTGTTNDAIQDFDAWCLTPGFATLQLVVTDQNNCTNSTQIVVSLRSCFDLAIRKRVALPNKQYYPGDTVTFNIEVFNQGAVNATDVRVSDILDINMQYNFSQNTSILTGNNSDWTAGTNDSIHIMISRINSGQKAVLKVILYINPNTDSLFMINTALISGKKSEVPFGATFRSKDNPIDEDEILPPFDSPPLKQPEKDDEICDSMNASLYPNECSLGDDTDDEDGEDFAIVSICQLRGNTINRAECVSSATRVLGREINTPELRDEMDPTGNGDGIINGDTGNRLTTVHNTYIDAMMGTNPITRRIIFSNGNGGINSSHGILTPQGDLRVFSNQEVQIFGRLLALDGCVGVSILTLDFTPQPEILVNPEDAIAILDQEDLCFEVVLDNTLGVPTTIQWQQQINNVFVDIPGATNLQYCLDQVTADDDRKQFRILTFESSDVLRTCAIASAAATLELEGDPVLVCNDLVNISLDDNCLAQITPDMVLEDLRFESRIRIRIVNSQGMEVPNPITSAYIGQTLTVHAIDFVNGNSCWGLIKIEDKLPPVITCPVDYTVSCANYNFTPPTPIFTDACDPTATIQLINNVLTELECGRLDSIIAFRVYTYVAKDKYGNISRPCTFRVYYKSENINRVNWPASIELTCRVASTYPAWDFNRNGRPDPSETGVPKISGLDLAFVSALNFISDNYCRVNVTYHDDELPLCGNTYKIIRDWTIVDWCNGIILKHIQLITVEDKEGPILTCPEDQNYDIFTQDHTCTTDFIVPAPIVISDCNITTWSVAYLLADINGAAPVNGPYITENVVVTGLGYTITDLPLGRTWLRYTVTDACDNITYCFTEVTVQDKIKPTPICDEFTVVTLSQNGKALIYAPTFDDGSHDNCSKVTFSVRRLTSGCNSNGSSDDILNPFGSFVAFCCSDVGQDVMVELKVKDASGNENSCMVIANVQDKVIPVITCPLAVIISCGADTSANVLGKPIFSATPIAAPYYSDNCPDLELTWQNSGIISDCGQGVIIRTFTVTDKAGNKASCVQRITVRNNTPYSGPTLYVAPSPHANGVIWKNLEPRSMTGCMNSDTDPSNTGEPELGNGACSSVAKNYEDQILPFVDGVCFKILRKWTVIDWCKFSPNTDVNGALYPNIPVLGVNMWTYIQTIAVSENDAPVLQKCSKGDTETFANNCTAQVDLTNSATDCTPNDKLRWSYTMDINNDAIGPFITGSTSNASGSFPVGTHNIIWTVEDMCGNQSTCSYTFRVLDKKKPTPYCISEITTVIMPSVGQVELWARDFNKGSFDNCPLTGCGLRFTFNGFKPPVAISEVLFDVNGNIAGTWPTTNVTLLERYVNGEYQRWLPSTCSSAKIYTCDDLGPNEERMSVWDLAGNTDFCTVTLFVQANGTSCVGSRIAGNVGTENNGMVSDVIVILENMSSQESNAKATDTNGYFEFGAVTPGTSYTILPEKDTDHTNGVSTLDIVLIQRHILGLSDLGSPYKYKAADINNDHKITAADLVELRKLVLGIYSKLPNNTSWRFIDKSVEIRENSEVFAANQYVAVDNISTAMMQNNFVAVKVGDVNETATTNANNQVNEQRVHQTLTFATVDQLFSKGEIIKVPITADNFVETIGAQWTFNYDVSTLSFSNIESGALRLNGDNINVNDGQVTFSWNSFEGVSINNDEVLFTLIFKAVANSNVSNSLRISSDVTKAEAYTGDFDDINVELIIRNNSVNVFALDQNTPNPFASMTTISFTLSEDAEATMTIFDITGRIIKTIKGQYVKGRNEIVLSAEEFNEQGVMIYELESNGQKATKKMIQLHQ